MNAPGFIWSIIGFILILTPVILIHEIGHFIAARLSKIKVDEFGLGFPPRAVTLFERNGTKYSLNWIPLGGFVRPAGEDDPNIPGGLASASKRARFFVLVAGSVANLILALALFTILFSLPQPVTQVGIADVVPGSPAAVANLQIDDVLVEVNGQPIDGDFRILSSEISANAGSEVTLLVDRNGRLETITAIPRVPGTYDSTKEGALGISMTSLETGEVTQMGPISAFGLSAYTIYDIVYSTLTLPVKVLQNQVAASEARVVSVVGISQMAGVATRSSVENQRVQDVIWMTAVISVALGFTNLLPIPALDGGRILFVIIEAIRGRRLEPEREGMVHAIGMALLLGLMVMLIIKDIIDPIVLPS